MINDIGDPHVEAFDTRPRRKGLWHATEVTATTPF